jgi:hypothetical protein
VTCALTSNSTTYPHPQMPNPHRATVIRSTLRRESRTLLRAPSREQQGWMARCRMWWWHARHVCSCGALGVQQAKRSAHLHACMHATSTRERPARLHCGSCPDHRRREPSGRVLPARCQRQSMHSEHEGCCSCGGHPSHAFSTVAKPLLYVTCIRQAHSMSNVGLYAQGW